MAVVCDLVCLAIGPMSVDFFTLGGGGSTVCGNMELVRRAPGSQYSLVDGTFGVGGEALGFWMTTLGIKSWGWSLVGRRIGRSIECCLVRVGGGVVTCGTFATGSVGLAHRWMAWWSACIDASWLLHAIVGDSCKAHVSVVMPWKMRSIGVTSGSVRLWCLNSNVSETWSNLVALDTTVWHW